MNVPWWRRSLRPRWPVWTTRRLLVVVALVGLALGGVDLARRRNHYQIQAVRHELLAYFWTHGHHHRGPDLDRARFHETLRLKYLRAADRPWRSVESDPPRP